MSELINIIPTNSTLKFVLKGIRGTRTVQDTGQVTYSPKSLKQLGPSAQLLDFPRLWYLKKTATKLLSRYDQFSSEYLPLIAYSVPIHIYAYL